MKNNKNFLIFLVLNLFTVLMLLTCKPIVSLGTTVDVVPPEGKIIYPPVGTHPIRGSFIMTGEAGDDNTLSSVSVVFENNETKVRTKAEDVKLTPIGSGKFSWIVTIKNEPSTVDGHPLVKNFFLTDGKYTAIVTLTDSSGKTLELTREYTIDNTPPVFIVSRPAVAVRGEDSAVGDKYGASFIVDGEAGEENDVEDLILDVPDKSINIVKKYVGKTIKVEAAKYAPDDELYQLQEKEKNKDIRAKIYLSDNARLFSDGKPSGTGNKSEWYYLKDEIYADIMAKGFTADVIHDYFAGKKSSAVSADKDKLLKRLYDDSDAEAKNIRNLLFSKRYMMDGSESSRAVFNLDPGKSPGFKVLNAKILESGISDTGKVSNVLYSDTSAASLLLELIRNKDRTPLLSGYNLDVYKSSGLSVKLYRNKNADTVNITSQIKNLKEFNEGNLDVVKTLNFADLTQDDLDNKIVQPDNGGLKIKFTLPQTEGYYLIKVEGKDVEGNSYAPYDENNSAIAGDYIFNLLSVGNGPRIRPIRIEELKNKGFDFTLTITGLSNGQAYFKIGGDAGTSDTPLILDTTDATKTKYKGTISDTVMNDLSHGKHIIHFYAVDTKGKFDRADTDFEIDKKAPELTINSPDFNANLSGDIIITGRINDNGTAVKSLGYIKGKQSSEPDLESTGWEPIDFSSGSWKIDFSGANTVTTQAQASALGVRVPNTTLELYDIPLYFLVSDKLDNKEVIKKVLRVDPNGDIPNVKILAPADGVTLGGTIRISGTVSVPKPETAQVASMWIQITNKKNSDGSPDFSSGAVFGGIDWCPADGKQLDGFTAGGAYWALEINGNKEFEPASGNQQTIWFRLKGKNNRTPNPVAGEWTAPVKIIVDKAAPKIEGVKIATEPNFETPIPSTFNPENQAYVSNMWIKGDDLYLCADLSHSAGIEKIDISGSYVGSSTIELIGDSNITGTNINNSGKAWFVQSNVGSSTDAKNYKMRIPLKTTTNPGSNNEFTLTVTIKAKKSGNAEDLTASSSYSIKYDNKAPTAVFGTKIYSSGTFTVRSASFTDSVLAGKPIKPEMRILASGKDIRISAFDSASGMVTLESSPVSGSETADIGYFIYSPTEYFRPDLNGDVTIEGAAYDVGAGIENVKIKYTIGTDETDEITLKSGDGVISDVGQGNVNFVTLKKTLSMKKKGSPSEYVADGSGRLIIAPIDKAHNAPAAISVTVKHKRNELKISSAGLGTDINRNGTIETGETKDLTLTPYDAEHPQGINIMSYDWKGKSDAGTFRFKNNKSHIKIGTIGGNGDKKYSLYCKSSSKDIHALKDLPSNGVIVLDVADFTNIGQSTGLDTANPAKRKLLLTVWDSAQGLTCGTDTWKAELELDVIVDTEDRVAPTNTMNPFKWVSETDNSLYENKRANGHIEIGTDLPSNFNQTSGLNDKDDKVSGKISITGTAHDDQVITEILAKIDDFTFTGISEAGSGTEVKLATYYNSSGSFTVENGNFASNGWHFTVLSNNFSVETGHTVKWQLDWDSSKIAGGVGTDKTIKITVKDASGDTTHTVPATLKVDVVPYITGLSRNSTYNTKRARSGAIPLLRGEEGNTLTGFNFASGGTTSLKITENKAGSGSSVEMENLTLSGSSFTFKVPDTAKDGYLHLVVNGVPAVNNINAYTASNTEESDTYGAANHSDDRFVHIWRVSKQDTFKGSKNAIYPAMTKGTDGTLYASFSNYSNAKVYYSKAFTGDADVEVGGTGDDIKPIFTGYDPPEETDITVAGTEVNVFYAANYHGGKTRMWGDGTSSFPWNDTDPGNAGGIYIYDKDAQSTDVGNSNTANMYRFELFTYDNELQQFKNIRTLRSGNNIYTVYYDRLTGAVKFSWVDDSKKPDTSSKALPWCVIDGNTDVTDRENKVPDAPESAASDQKKFTFVSPGPASYKTPYVLNSFEDELSVSNAVWESIAIAVTKNGYPVVVYMDAATGNLRLARSTSTQPTQSSDWTIQRVLDTSDPNGKLASDYINAIIGTDGVLHIAFQNTKGQLVYVKSTNTSDNGSTKYTFGTSEVLDDSGMSIDMAMNGTTPYITYMSRPNSYDAIRIAYKASMDFGNTGTAVDGWETMTAPLNERAANGRICIETQAKHFGAAATLPAAVGFTTGSDYRAAFYVGK